MARDAASGVRCTGSNALPTSCSSDAQELPVRSGRGERVGLPTLTDDYPIADSEIGEYRAKGHTCLRGLASPDEVEAFRPALEHAAHEHGMERRPLEERNTYGRAFLQTHNLWVTSRAVQAFVFAQRFAGVAAALMEVSAVRLYHDQALFKEPGGGATPWHQDQFYWPLDTDRTITLWMPLVGLLPEVGSMHFASGSQRFGHLGDYGIGDESQRVFEEWIEEHGLAIETHGALSAGDATFHSGWTLHRAEPNRTEAMRPAMTIIYFADGAKVASLDHPARRLDREIYLPDCAPGELVDSPLTPRLHPREFEALPEPPEITRDYEGWLVGAVKRARRLME
jgi:ectoine hydroxylase-related dioxygenase (phytanoyl-CoA dioxygenase family)